MDSDRRALLNAILAAPDDDAPRLVFADWLDDQGEGERAEMIRVAAAEGRRPKSRGPLDGRTKAGRRFMWLSDRVFAEWRSKGFAYSMYNVRRGFIESVTCLAADWLAHAAAILAEHPVREVRLRTLDPDSLVSLGRMAHSRTGWRVSTHPGMGVADALAALWPGIAFTLPDPHGGFLVPQHLVPALEAMLVA